MNPSENNNQHRDVVFEASCPNPLDETSDVSECEVKHPQKVLAFVLKRGKTYKKIITLKTSDVDDQELIRLILSEYNKNNNTPRSLKEEESRDSHSTSPYALKNNSTRSVEGQRYGIEDMEGVSPCKDLIASLPVCGENAGFYRSLNHSNSCEQVGMSQDHAQNKCFDSSVAKCKHSNSCGEVGMSQDHAQNKCFDSSVAKCKINEGSDDEDVNPRIYNICGDAELEHVDSSCDNRRRSQVEDFDKVPVASNASYHEVTTSSKHIQPDDTFDEGIEGVEGKCRCYDYFDISQLTRALTVNNLQIDHAPTTKCDDTQFVDAIVDSTFILSDFFCEQAVSPKRSNH
jgi:hypothetical protein